MELKKRRSAQHIEDNQKSYELSALIYADSFFYAVRQDNALIASDEVPFTTVEERLAQIKQSFILDHVDIAIFNDQFTLIPQEDFEEGESEHYLRYALRNHPKDLTGLYKTDYDEVTDSVIVYEITRELHDRCLSLHPSVELHHAVTSLRSRMSHSNISALVHLCKIGNKVLLLVIQDRALSLATVISADRPVNVLYYTTLAAKVCGLAQDDLVVELSGGFVVGSNFDVLLRRYFDKVSYPPSSLTIDGDRLDTSLYYPLESFKRCVL